MENTRRFDVQTPLGVLRIRAKHDTDSPADFPGVYVDFVWPDGEYTLLACVEYDSVSKFIQTCVYKNSWEDEPAEVVEHIILKEEEDDGKDRDAAGRTGEENGK